MTTFEIIGTYLCIGLLCAFCFDILMDYTENGETKWYERLMWITLWPLFCLIFIFGIWR